MREQEEAKREDSTDMDLNDEFALNGESEVDVAATTRTERGMKTKQQSPPPENGGDDAREATQNAQDVLETGAVHEGAVVERNDDNDHEYKEHQQEPEGP